jgi:predicted O-methyltransferase YrrM
MIESRGTPATLAGLHTDMDAMLALWSQIAPHLEAIPFGAKNKDPFRYRLENPAYAWGDGYILYAMLMLFNPKRIVEIGSGWSTVCMLDTIQFKLGGNCDLTSIEPFPDLLRQLIASGAAPKRILDRAVQDVAVEVFDDLGQGDILFIDSTHVARTGSDVCHELFEILPRLKPGVLVHFHDVFWPFEYPRSWAVAENRSWSEIYLIRALLTRNPEWQILMFNDYFAKLAPSSLREVYPEFFRHPGGALWLRKLPV